MKTKTIFKKSAILFTVIALAVVMSIAAVVAIAAGTNGETFAGVSVSTSGNVMLKFHYSDLGNADSVVYEVEGKAPVTLTADAVKANGGVVEVPLAAAEMTKNVTVYTMAGEVQGKPHTWSVKKYADKILYNDLYADDHQTVRAMLLYGAQAQAFFGVKEDALASDGVFYGNTAPIANLTAFNGVSEGSAVSTNEEVLRYAGIEASASSYTWIKFYFNYNGAGTPTATVSREGLEAQQVAVKKSSNGGYYVMINNVSAKLYNTPYTVTVTDGADTLTMQKSVANWFVAALADEDAKNDSVAKAMYQYYLMVAKVKLDTESCEHANFHLIMRNDKTYSVVCSDCFLEDKQVAATGIADYVSAFESVIGRGNVGTHYVTADADGTFYHRFYGSKTDGQDGAEPGLKSDGINAKGKYLVFKIRTNYTTSNEFGLYIRLEGQSAYYYARLDASKVIDGEWNVFVVDMSKLIQRWGDGDDVNYELGDPDQNGNQWYPTIIQSWLFNIAPGVDHTTKYIDVAYAAVVEEFDDIAVLVGNEAGDIYSWDGTQGVLTKKTVGDYCSGDHTAVSNDHKTHTVAPCDVCGYKGVTENHTLSYDSASNTYGCACGYSVAGKASADGVLAIVRPENMSGRADENKLGQQDLGVKYENGVVYRSFTGIDGSSRAGTHGIYMPLSLASGHTGRYIVIKMRTSMPSSGGFTWYVHLNGGDTNVKANPAAVCTGDWVTYVFDMAQYGNSKYAPDTNGYYAYNLKNLLMTPWAVGWGENFKNHTIDVAYAAVVEDLDGVVALIDANSVGFGTADATSTNKTKAELCGMAGNDHSYIINQDGTHTTPSCDKCGLVGGVTEAHTYTYNSTNNTYNCVCGYSVAGVAVNDSVNDIVRPEQMNTYSSFYTDKLGVKTEDGVVYYSITGLNLTKEEYSHGFELKNDGYIVGARYIVLKVRTSISTHSSWQMHFNGGSGWVGPAASVLTAGEWMTYVIDMANYGHSFYKPNAEGKYPTFASFLLLPRANAGDYTNSTIDVAYIATVTDLEGVVALIGEDNVSFQTMSGSATKMTSKELCAMTHTYTDNGDGTHTIQACDKCGAVAGATEKHTYDANKICACGNSIADIEFYYAPSNLMGSNGVGFASQGIATDKDGTKYFRIVGNNATANNSAYFNIMNNTTITTGGARYVALKVRTNLTNYSYFNFFANFGSTSAKGIIMSSAVNGAAGEWVTIVLDLAQLYSQLGYTATNGAYPNITRMALVLQNDQTVTPTDYVDVAYVALADSLADLVKLVDQPTVQFSNVTDRTANKFITLSTADELAMGGYYWSANELEGANGTGFSGSVVTSEGGVDFVRVTGNGTTAGGTARFNIETAVTTTGTGRYVALKVRTNTQFNYFNFLGAFSGNTTESGIIVKTALPATEDWVTIVIDLEKCYSDKNYVKSGVAYPNFTKLQLILQTDAATTADQYVDVAYVAMASSLADLATVIDQPTVEYFNTSRTSGTHTNVNVADLATMQ